jgi:hypothetical protein
LAPGCRRRWPTRTSMPADFRSRPETAAAPAAAETWRPSWRTFRPRPRRQRWRPVTSEPRCSGPAFRVCSRIRTSGEIGSMVRPAVPFLWSPL